MPQKNYFSDTTDPFLLDYLFLQPGGELTETLLHDAQRALEKYRKQIEAGAYGMALYSDFQNWPYILEDEDLYTLKHIADIGGIVVYEKIERAELGS